MEVIIVHYVSMDMVNRTLVVEYQGKRVIAAFKDVFRHEDSMAMYRDVFNSCVEVK